MPVVNENALNKEFLFNNDRKMPIELDGLENLILKLQFLMRQDELKLKII
jgi:hypothetical protein